MVVAINKCDKYGVDIVSEIHLSLSTSLTHTYIHSQAQHTKCDRENYNIAMSRNEFGPLHCYQ